MKGSDERIDPTGGENKRSELLFTEHELRLLRLINNASLGMVVLNQSHRVVESNQKFADMLGYTMDELFQLHTWDWEGVFSRQDIERDFADLSHTEFSIETKHRRKDGTLIDVGVSGTGIRLGKEKDDSAILCFVQDISERKRTEALLVESERKFKSFVEHSADLLLTVNDAGDVDYISPNCKQILGFDPDALTGKRLLRLFKPADRRAFMADIRAAFSGNTRPAYEYQIRQKDNRYGWYSIRFSPFSIDQEHPLMIVNARDVTYQKENELKLLYIGTHDQLTGIFNRKYFADQLEKQALPFSILSFDLDDLKDINDQYGHAMGDKILIQCANLVSEAIRENDIFTRVGGDEFSVLLPQTSKAQAREVARRINVLIEQYNRTAEPPYISISIGIAEKNKPEVPVETVLKRADERMYQEKREKKCGVLAAKPGPSSR